MNYGIKNNGKLELAENCYFQQEVATDGHQILDYQHNYYEKINRTIQLIKENNYDEIKKTDPRLVMTAKQRLLVAPDNPCFEEDHADT